MIVDAVLEMGVPVPPDWRQLLPRRHYRFSP